MQADTGNCLLHKLLQVFEERENVIGRYDQFKTKIKDRLRVISLRHTFGRNAREKQVIDDSLN